MIGSEHQIWPNRIIASLFQSPWIGFGLAIFILVWAVLIIVRNGLKYHRPFSRQLEARLAATQFVSDEPNDWQAQETFAARYEDIDAAMMAGGKEAAELRHAWTQFTETIVDKDETTLRATSRPEGYFLHLGDDTRILAWWANIFVAMGLTFTFLGIIAALVRTVDGLSDGNTSAMQSALIGLLTITAAKFWTSIGGVAASIILRWFDRRWHSVTERRLETLCDRIEYGTLFSPPQRIAADQLRELKQQTIAMSEFSTKLAVGIADALGEKMQPVIRGLSGIQTSIDDFKGGAFGDIGKEMGAALKEGAGAEMAMLAKALTDMTGNLQGVNDRLEGASGSASEQIATAAREFSVASEQMTRAFQTLNDNISGMSDRLTTQAEAAADRAVRGIAEQHDAYEQMADGQRKVMGAMGEEMRNASTVASAEMVRAVKDAVSTAMAQSNTAIQGALDGFTGATAGIQSAFDAMKGQVADLGEKLSGSASQAADRNADVLAKAAATLEAATAQASTGMGKAIDEAITRSAEESSRAISAAFAAFGEKFDMASNGLVDTLRSTAGRMEVLSNAIERSTGAANDHAIKLSDAGREAQGVATMLGRAANDIQGAAGPIREATGRIDSAVGQTQAMLTAMNERSAGHAETVQRLSASLEQTSASAGNAWSDYRERFEGVDQDLAAALEKIKGASTEHAVHLNDYVGKIDKALADAVLRLEGPVISLAELSGQIEDLLSRLERK
ncbi:methyl-accepting chemotaxis protein [Sphingomonas zeicaulis]|uniref:hypothetical protein n=1 Tax=Sphingomonas zeicaulis TaxID=1632740 RepID=UPI003D22D78E